MEEKFKKELKSLDKVFGFIGKFISKYNLNNSIVFTLNLVVEELFTNMLKYNSKNINDVVINLKKENNKLIICLTEYNVAPFDLTKTQEVNVKEHLEERKVGGLGIHLVKKMVDQIDYKYEDKNRISKIILIKNLEK